MPGDSPDQDLVARPTHERAKPKDGKPAMTESGWKSDHVGVKNLPGDGFCQMWNAVKKMWADRFNYSA
jgi:hypothetical protein